MMIIIHENIVKSTENQLFMMIQIDAKFGQIWCVYASNDAALMTCLENKREISKRQYMRHYRNFWKVEYLRYRIHVESNDVEHLN